MGSRLKARIARYISLLLAMVGAFVWSTAVSAADVEGDWKRGRIYYRMVCTDCHKQMTGEGISPMSMTISQWEAYLEADQHDKSSRSNPSLGYYVSKPYRDSIKANNRVAAKYIDLSDEQLLGDIEAWVKHGASDSDTPARCQ